MPEITLDLVSMDSAPLPVARSCTFDGLGGTIGRDEGNTLVLQDKHRRVSRLHASVTFPDGQPTITNASTSLPLSLGTRLLNCGQKMPLSAGDLIEIGPYILKVRAVARLGATSNVELGSNNVPVPVSVAREIQATHLDVDFSFASPSVTSPAAASALDISGLFGLEPAKPVSSPASPAAVGSDPFADLFAGIGPASVGGFAGSGTAVDALKSAPLAPPNPSLTPPTHVVVDPFASLLDMSVKSVAPTPPQGFGGNTGSATSFPAQAANPYRAPDPAPAGIIPEDFNPFDLPSGTTRNSADPLAQLLGGGSTQPASSVIAAEPSIDALFAPGGSSSPFDSVSSSSSLGAYSPQGLDILSSPAEASDPMMMFGVSSTGSRDLMRQPMRDDLPEIGGAYQPPRALMAGSGMGFSGSGNSLQGGGFAQQNVIAPVNPDVLTEAFLRGAGLPPQALPSGLTPEVMVLVGGLLRNATAGAIDMLAARAATKLEVQASVTIISSQSNNPLKFLPNAEVALQQMLGKKMPGFMRADEAMRDAFDDLRAHEIGVIAGTRAALTEVLGRFDPALLGDRLTGATLLDNLLPSMRKTKLWEIYLERYAQIRREAEDDFQSVFGRSFLQAYERETARVKAQTTEFGKQ